MWDPGRLPAPTWTYLDLPAPTVRLPAVVSRRTSGGHWRVPWRARFVWYREAVWRRAPSCGRALVNCADDKERFERYLAMLQQIRLNRDPTVRTVATNELEFRKLSPSTTKFGESN